MAFLEVVIVLSANLSDERIFNGVFEQRLIYNQPVEVRVGPRVSGSSKVISPGGYGSFKSSFSQGFLIPTSLNRPLPAAENCFGMLALVSIILKMLLSCDLTLPMTLPRMLPDLLCLAQLPAAASYMMTYRCILPPNGACIVRMSPSNRIYLSV